MSATGAKSVTKCPECDITLLKKNLARHFRTKHEEKSCKEHSYSPVIAKYLDKNNCDKQTFHFLEQLTEQHEDDSNDGSNSHHESDDIKELDFMRIQYHVLCALALLKKDSYMMEKSDRLIKVMEEFLKASNEGKKKKEKEHEPKQSETKSVRSLPQLYKTYEFIEPDEKNNMMYCKICEGKSGVTGLFQYDFSLGETFPGNLPREFIHLKSSIAKHELTSTHQKHSSRSYDRERSPKRPKKKLKEHDTSL